MPDTLGLRVCLCTSWEGRPWPLPLFPAQSLLRPAWKLAWVQGLRHPCLEQNQAGAGPGGLRQSCPFRPPTMHSPLVAQPVAPNPSPAARASLWGEQRGQALGSPVGSVALCCVAPQGHPPPPPFRARALFPTRTGLGGGPGGGLSLGPLSPVRDLEDSCPLLTLEALC
ncbi:unnamed protein product [Rangifer tarandus platyrhynchus]|uniref:Uncharacterized protein n=2 Tax=Rangifer tarandus platyrhynchus TaxID=3082113 RepID=A0ABN8YWQ2_RANTA|nr:unnamed protein product [Rangifer tarandus platyrhynchus]